MTSPSERQARIIWLAATGLAIVALVAVVVLLIWGLGRVLDVLSPVLWPLAVAGVIAYLLNPVVNYFEKKAASTGLDHRLRFRHRTAYCGCCFR